MFCILNYLARLRVLVSLLHMDKMLQKAFCSSRGGSIKCDKVAHAVGWSVEIFIFARGEQPEVHSY